MAVTATPVFIQTPKLTPQRFVQGSDVAGTFKTICTAGANGTKVVGVLVATDDGSATHVLTMRILRSATGYNLIDYTLPVTAGTGGATASVDLLAGGPSSLFKGLPVDNDGQPYLFLESGDTLELTFATALTSGKTIYCNVISGNY